MAWNLDRVAPPWDVDRPSLFAFIAERLDEDGSLGLTPPSLPDEVRDPTKVSYGAGTLDGISRHFGVASAEDDVVTAIVGAVTKLARRATSRSAQRLYDVVTETATLEYVDRVLAFLPSSGTDPGRIGAIGRWLATEGRDRSAVKFGIALIGASDTELLLTLGAHDEFTLYSAVALGNAGAGERALFDLAKRVHGWGRIECVERLADTTDDEIRQWMLHDGYKNSVMYEYLAHTCARTGGLLDALTAAEPGDDLVDTAGELLPAILTGQPGPPPADYPDLVPVLRRYLELIHQRPGSLQERAVVSSIRRFLDQPDDVTVPPDTQAAMTAQADEFVSRPHFPALVEAGLADDDTATYWLAKEAALDLGVDIYDATYSRIHDDIDEHPPWFDLLRATDDARLDRTLDLARTKIDLDAVATGPADEMGLGPGYEADSILGWVLQELGRFPGSGWDFLAAGLRNRVVRHRNMAIRALRDWPRNRWPAGAEAALEALITDEVRDGVRRFASDVLRGDVPIDEAWRRAVAELEDRSPSLARMATALAATPQGRRLRVEPGYGQFAIWDGPYDTTPWDRRHVVVADRADGLGVRISDDPDAATPSDGLTHDDAVTRAATLMNRLLTD